MRAFDLKNHLTIAGAVLLAFSCANESVCANGACDQTTAAADSSSAAPNATSDDGGKAASAIEAGLGQAEAGGAADVEDGSVGSTSPSQNSDATSPIDPKAKPTPCQADRQCQGIPSTPICSTVDGFCVACTDDSQCPSASPFCDMSPDAEDNRCVGCLSDDDCVQGGGVCVTAINACLNCDPVNSGGCSTDRPFCVVQQGQLDVLSLQAGELDVSCVECRDDKDCGGETPICDGGQCTACSLDGNRGCADEQLCVELAPGDAGVTLPRMCAQCASTADCAADAPYCVEGRCSECNPPDDEGCDSIAPFCLSAADWADDTAASAPAPANSVTPGAACYECKDNADCPTDERPACVSGTCVECATDEECTTPSASRCDAETNTCVPCSEKTDCAHLTGRPVCYVPESNSDAGASVGSCVECTALDRRACDNGAGVCKTTPGYGQFTCTGHEEARVGVCQQCEADADCLEGMKCVEMLDVAASLGFFCLHKEGVVKQSCADDARPFSAERAAVSVDGSQGNFCFLSTTTCAGFRDYLETSCRFGADCGEPGSDADGYCIEYNGKSVCSYACDVDQDCTVTSYCDDTDTPAVCRQGARP